MSNNLQNDMSDYPDPDTMDTRVPTMTNEEVAALTALHEQQRQQNDLFLDGALHFIKHTAPAMAKQPNERAQLVQLLDHYSRTDRDPMIQFVLHELHARFDLSDLVDASYLKDIIQEVERQVFGTLQNGAGLIYSRELERDAPDQSTSASGQSPAPGRTPLAATIPTATPAQAVVGARDAAQANSTSGAVTSPAPVQGFSIPDRSKDWFYVCDICGWHRKYRSEFARHVRDGTGRANFRVVTARPDVEERWFGEDGNGNTYSGAMVAVAGCTWDSMAPGVGEPCRRASRALAANKS